jgi:hypothetical protein
LPIVQAQDGLGTASRPHDIQKDIGKTGFLRESRPLLAGRCQRDRFISLITLVQRT